LRFGRWQLDRGVPETFAELAGASALAGVGCGSGHVPRFPAARNMRVIGVSPRMLAVAREHAPALALDTGHQ
jgi:trans-aconitate methyltransferase